VGADD
jgi:hypothetical protein